MQTLKEAREARGIKQSAVADALEVTRQTYAKYENKPQVMPIEKAIAACDFIGCDLNDVIFSASNT